MRSLVRLSLFIFARLGLFLAVVAWVVGSFKTLEFNSQRFLLNVDRNGYSFLVGAEKGHFAYDLVAIAESIDDISPGLRSQSESWFGPQNFEKSSSVMGVHMGNVGAFHVIHFPHWLATLVFALIYLILKIAYRQKDAPAPD